MKQHIDGHIKLMILQHVQDERGLTPSELAVFLAIIRDAKDFHPSIALITKRAGLSVSSVRRAIARLIGDKILFRRLMGVNNVSHYSIHSDLFGQFKKYMKKGLDGRTEAEILEAEGRARMWEAEAEYEREEGEAADLRARLNADAGIPYSDYPGDKDEE